MPRKLLTMVAALSGVAALLIGAADARITTNPLTGMTAGAVPLMSAGPLAFGPDGVLFVGDSVGGQIVAIDTGDRTRGRAHAVNVKEINVKIAAMVGVEPDQVIINGVDVDPISKNVYLSASRGRGPDAMPLIVRVNGDNQITVLSLNDLKHSVVQLTDAPGMDPPARGPNPRMLTITDMNYVDGNLMVAGLSNEEWSSALRSIPFPFDGPAAKGATIQIWHASHGRFETQAPILAFVPWDINGKKYVLAAYLCTPLVTIPFSDLSPGAKVHGETIADLGAGNQPRNMIPYTRDGQQYILINNTSRGVMKLKADHLGTYQPITEPTTANIAGVPYTTVASLKDVLYLAPLDNKQALAVVGQPGPGPALPRVPSGPVNLETIELP
jgi:hypothetical protein